MARPSGKKIFNNGQWTEARMNTFIRNLLRQGSIKWSPIQLCKTKARISRGWYLCAGCGDDVPASIRNEDTGKRETNIFVDHREPVVPLTGFTTWDDYIKRLFCEVDNLDLLCKPCHDEKTSEEAAIRAEHRKEK